MRNSAFHVIDNTILQTDCGSSPLTCTPEHSRNRSGEECDGDPGDCRAGLHCGPCQQAGGSHASSSSFSLISISACHYKNSIQIDAHRSDIEDIEVVLGCLRLELLL